MPVARSPPMKTQRTSAENKERAFIAASRRSDRSLEARIQSAEKASEIHKQRTGRALRVTREDVENEEMYEEEDDGMRRFMTHITQLPYMGLLSTQQGPFGPQGNVLMQRFHDQMSANVGMRDQLQAMIQASQAIDAQGQGIMNPQADFKQSTYALNHQLPPTSPSAPAIQSQAPARPGMVERSPSYRAAPYPQHRQQRQQDMQHRASIASPLNSNGDTEVKSYDETRRLSMPSNYINPSQSRSNSISARSPTASNGNRPCFPPGSFNARFNRPTPVPDLTSVLAQPFNDQTFNNDSAQNNSLYVDTNAKDTFPLTTALPANVQMALGSSIPADSHLMAGSDSLAQWTPARFTGPMGPGVHLSFQDTDPIENKATTESTAIKVHMQPREDMARGMPQGENTTSGEKAQTMGPTRTGLASTLQPTVGPSYPPSQNEDQQIDDFSFDDFIAMNQMDNENNEWSTFMDPNYQ